MKGFATYGELRFVPQTADGISAQEYLLQYRSEVEVYIYGGVLIFLWKLLRQGLELVFPYEMVASEVCRFIVQIFYSNYCAFFILITIPG